MPSDILQPLGLSSLNTCFVFLNLVVVCVYELGLRSMNLAKLIIKCSDPCYWSSVYVWDEAAITEF